MAEADEKRQLLGSTALIAVITGVSRIFGLFREQVKALLLGTSIAGDAFTTAYIIPNLLRRLVGEGAMTAAFVPVFTDYIKGKKKSEVWGFAASFFVVMSCLLAVIAVLGVATAPLLIRYGFGVGYASVPGKVGLTIFLTRLMFPYILLVGLAAVAQAMLNSFRRFAVPAATPILLNLATITCALLFSHRFETPATAFAIGVLVGGFLQVAVQLPFLYKMGLQFRSTIDVWHPGIRKVLWLMVPGLFGVGIYQINVAVSQAIASAQDSGAVSSLQYSGRILELILGVFVVSLATVILPRLSRQAAAGDREAMASTGLFAIRMVAFVTIPATIGTILLRAPLVDILFRFKGGVFDTTSSSMTQAALQAHIVGLLFIGCVRVVVPLFFALKDTKTPVIAAAIGMLVNIVLCVTLPPWLRQKGLFGHVGIAFANSASAAIQLGLLLILIRRRLPRVGVTTLLGSFARMASCAALMGVACAFATDNLVPAVEAGKLAQLGGVGAVVALSVAVYAVAGALLGSPELKELVAIVTGRTSSTEQA